ncbi:flagellar basal body rod protein FlgC [Alteromonas sp. S015]|uniref:flagellar basal body rod protein FlgC n=1 Tax=Alteromonas sp. S015 TaxID=3117401 RepID=UPI002FE0FBE7
MSFDAIYSTGASAMRAQVMRLDTIASNLANANTVASSENDAYRAVKPVFETVYQQTETSFSAQVNMAGVVQTDRPVDQRYEPNNPLSDADGYVYYSNVNELEEMADMMSASRSFQTATSVLNRVSGMQQSILSLGQR